MPINEFKKSVEETIEAFQRSIEKIRIGRATPSMIEDIHVDYYGTPTPLQEIAAISSPEPTQLLIEPWDKEAIPQIEQALLAAELGSSPIAEGGCIRITLPPLTEERRRDAAKELHKEMEETRIRIRTLREKTWKTVQEQEENGTITEDERFRQKDQLQEIVDNANKRLEEMVALKEKQLMER